MSIGTLFWFLMILWLVFGLSPRWWAGSPTWFSPAGDLLLFILLFLLGWKSFGFILHA